MNQDQFELQYHLLFRAIKEDIYNLTMQYLNDNNQNKHNMKTTKTIKCIELFKIDPTYLLEIEYEYSSNNYKTIETILKTLLDFGADPSRISLYENEEIPIIHQYVLIGAKVDAIQKSTYELLIKHASNINVVDNWNRNIGHLLYDLGFGSFLSEEINWMIKYGLDMNAKPFITDEEKVITAKMKNTLPKS